jgi:hypothetical protein
VRPGNGVDYHFFVNFVGTSFYHYYAAFNTSDYKVKV